MRVDLGDVELRLDLLIKGARRQLRWHFSAPLESQALRTDLIRASRTLRERLTSPQRRDITMDLMADKQVDATIEWTDEVGNPTTAPANATVTFTVDNTAVINLTDHGDGSATFAATGQLGTANVHVDATGDGVSVTADAQIVVVAGLAERANVVFGEPTEVTPDV